MTRNILVADEQSAVISDEQLGQLARKQHDLFRRVREGTLPVERVLDDLQRVIKGNFDVQFTFQVNNDDPRWGSIDRERCAYVGDIAAKDYSRGRGTETVTCRYLEFDHDPTEQEVLDWAKVDKCRQPSRAIVETFIEKNPYEPMRNPVIGLCVPVVYRDGRRYVPFVYANADGVRLDWRCVDGRWGRRCRFLVVCESSTTC